MGGLGRIGSVDLGFRIRLGEDGGRFVRLNWVDCLGMCGYRM